MDARPTVKRNTFFSPFFFFSTPDGEEKRHERIDSWSFSLQYRHIREDSLLYAGNEVNIQHGDTRATGGAQKGESRPIHNRRTRSGRGDSGGKTTASPRGNTWVWLRTVEFSCCRFHCLSYTHTVSISLHYIDRARKEKEKKRKKGKYPMIDQDESSAARNTRDSSGAISFACPNSRLAASI